MLTWRPPKPEAFILNADGKHGPGATLPGGVEDYPESVRPWLVPVEAAAKGLPAPAPEAKPAPIDEPAPAVQAERPDLSGLHWRHVARLSDGLGYGADDRSKAARLAWLDTLPAADVAAALAALED